jgi:thiol-disulfide isomerase/thioredoxin
LAAGATTEISRQQDAERPDATAARAQLDALIARYPQSKSVGALEVAYGKMLSQVDPVAGEAHLTRLAAGSDPEAARRAGAELRLVQLRTKPMELKFTAADGREVDLAKLRGKVVLIDFWATWCGPCIAELPNLTRVYETYHDKGFEIVGISFENSGAIDEVALRHPRNAGKALDRPEVVASEKAAAKEKMLKFTRERKMPWPQHFDGNYWENEFGRMFGINSIPAMFLLDKSGRLVETNARGEKLEPLVKKLLGLSS